MLRVSMMTDTVESCFGCVLYARASWVYKPRESHDSGMVVSRDSVADDIVAGTSHALHVVGHDSGSVCRHDDEQRCASYFSDNFVFLLKVLCSLYFGI